jgi:hypothetical protein
MSMKSSGGKAAKSSSRDKRHDRGGRRSWMMCCKSYLEYLALRMACSSLFRRLVGGTVGGGISNNSPEELAKELETFDMKVYRAQTQMAKEMNTRLRSLGVPFFGTTTELVRIAGKDRLEGRGVDGPKDEKGMINENELVKLQRRMLVILEDICTD